MTGASPNPPPLPRPLSVPDRSQPRAAALPAQSPLRVLRAAAGRSRLPGQAGAAAPPLPSTEAPAQGQPPLRRRPERPRGQGLGGAQTAQRAPPQPALPLSKFGGTGLQPPFRPQCCPVVSGGDRTYPPPKQDEEGEHRWLGSLRAASDPRNLSAPSTHLPTHLLGPGAPPHDLKPLGGHMVRGNQVPERSKG